MAGTRIAPLAGICHAVSDNFSICEMSMAPTLNIHDALRAPLPGTILDNRKFSQRGALDFNGRVVPLHGDRFASCDSMKPMAINADLEVSKNHVSRGHLENDGIKPINEQELCIRRVTFDLHGFLEFDVGRVGHHSRHCQRRLLESGFKRRANSAYTDIRVMREMSRSQASRAFGLSIHSRPLAFWDGAPARLSSRSKPA